MNKSALILTASLILGFGMGTTTTSSQAASWHKGTPAALKGVWRTHRDKIATKTYEYYILKIKGTKIHDISVESHQGSITEDVGPMYVHNVHYRYRGNHTYQIKAKNDIGNTAMQLRIRWINRYKIRTYMNNGNHWVGGNYYR
ncbi:hypothetical protein [Lentilactobacillus hilgardii]|jgi:hypothetical protein|nr:hypothetical protein [Lentilactobacillus hilgardii]MCT3393094.1 hypothetical protein [Lentilactobacillus hilgardii]RRG10336.1 MAG: hypothetical protein DUD35_07990 [Lactobacillus sp.]